MEPRTSAPPDPRATLRRARHAYFEANGFGADGGYDASWFKVKLGPIAFSCPNTKARVRSVRLHDLHHVVTGYPTTLRGEAMIGAFELGGGCADHYAAWFLDANAFAYGILLDPRGLWRAFVRGRRSRNLYGCPFDDARLDRTVGELRDALGIIDDPGVARASDVPRFAGWIAVGVYLLAWSVALAPALALAGALQRALLRRGA